MRKVVACGAVLLGTLAPPLWADRADEELAAVKRAVGSVRVEAETSQDRSRAPQWFRVRIVDKSDKKAKVSVNLPLALVRAIGSDIRLEGCGRCGRHTLGEVLRALDAGENLVEIEDAEASVRVWVE